MTSAPLRRIHDKTLPAALRDRIPRGVLIRPARRVCGFLRQIEHKTFAEPVAAQTAAFLHGQRTRVGELVDRTEVLARRLRTDPLPCVLCHSDLHAGNLLMAGDGRLFIVDWDEPILAPASGT
ncbi:MAG: phosphotransferase [Caldilineales bacterium]